MYTQTNAQMMQYTSKHLEGRFRAVSPSVLPYHFLNLEVGMSLRFFLSKKKSILFCPKAPVLIHAQGVCTRKDEFPSLVNL